MVKPKIKIRCSIEIEYSEKNVWVKVHYATISHIQHYSKERQLSMLCRDDTISFHKQKQLSIWKVRNTAIVRLVLLLSNYKSKVTNLASLLT